MFFKFWWSYIDMVMILLRFAHAQRDGIWELHLDSFIEMLPYFHYDHLNYAKWGAVYVAEMNQILGEVEKEFQDGNLVVKLSNQTFNQLDPDNSQVISREHISKPWFGCRLPFVRHYRMWPDSGWIKISGTLKPVLMSLPLVPDTCMEIITCSCKTRCITNRYKCRKVKLSCTWGMSM